MNSTLRYLFALLMALAAAVIEAWFRSFFDPIPFFPFLVTVFASALLFGLGPSIVTTLASSLATHLIMRTPVTYSILMMVAGVALSWFVASRRRAERQQTDTELNMLRAAENEQQRLAQEITRQRERLLSIVSNVPGVVWEAWGEPDEGSQRINFVSDYVEEMLGYTPRSGWRRPTSG